MAPGRPLPGPGSPDPDLRSSRRTSLGADLVKVLDPAGGGGAAYLATARQPLGDIKMLAVGGFGRRGDRGLPGRGRGGVRDGAAALGADDGETRRRVARAIKLASGVAGTEAR